MIRDPYVRQLANRYHNGAQFTGMDLRVVLTGCHPRRLNIATYEANIKQMLITLERPRSSERDKRNARDYIAMARVRIAALWAEEAEEAAERMTAE